LSERQKDVGLEAPQDVLRGLQLPLDDHCAVLVASHVFETVLRVQPGPACLLVLGTCRIGAGGQQLTCLVAPMPYVSKRDFREDSKAQPVLLPAWLPEFNTPELATVGATARYRPPPSKSL
jgi:hypothetical protein